MKRGLLIGVGTLGSLGAVFAITPPQFGSSNSTGAALGAGTASTTTPSVASTPAPQPAATQQSAAPQKSAATTSKKATAKPATPKAVKRAAPRYEDEGEGDDEGRRVSTTVTTPSVAPAPAKSATPTPTKTTAPAPTPSKTTAPTPTPTQAQSTGSNGTFVGNLFAANEFGRNWGNVHVTVTINNGKITSINGDQSPASRGYMAFNQIDPYVAAQKVTISTIKSTASSALPYVSGATYSSIAYWDSLKTALKKAGL